MPQPIRQGSGFALDVVAAFASPLILFRKPYIANSKDQVRVSVPRSPDYRANTQTMMPASSSENEDLLEETKAVLAQRGSALYLHQLCRRKVNYKTLW